MNTFIIGILIINIICVGITDCTDAMNFVKKLLVYVLTKGKIYTDKYEAKLLTCSLCQTFHLSNLWLITYCIFLGEFNIWFLCVPILSALFTKQTYGIIMFLQDLVDTLIYILNKLLKLINKK